MSDLRPLGRSPIRITAIGLGCWQSSEGHGIAGAFWPALPQETANGIVAASLAGGINWFDTAEMHGRGRSEAALSRALLAAGRTNGDVVVATKWWPVLRTAAHAALAARGLPLVSNQVRYSLLDRRIESAGVLDAARELG